MDKTILIEYADMKEEIKDLRKRIDKLEKEIKRISVVSDSVKGTRPDGTYGSIRITGYPFPEERRKTAALKKYQSLLAAKEAELLELMTQVEEYIETIPKSELRIMFRFYYIDDLTWYQVALQMNEKFPDRRIKYTDDNCRIRHDRFLEKNT